jgi:hypothetical protein
MKEWQTAVITKAWPKYLSVRQQEFSFVWQNYHKGGGLGVNKGRKEKRRLEAP